jgi:beta-lactamase class A
MLRKLLFVVAFVVLSSVCLGQKVKPMPISVPSPLTLDEKIKAEVAGFKGNVWIYAKNLDNGKKYSLRGDEKVRTASTIKLPIMTEVFRQIAEGKIKWTDEFILSKENKQGGSGILSEFTDGTKIDVKTAVNLMITISDNTATNLLIDKVSSNNVNAFMKLLGLNDTLSLRKIGGGGDAKAWEEPVNKLFGIGVTSPKDMVTLLEKLEKGEVVSKEASAEMIAILKRQQYTDGLGRNLLDTVPIASKSGSLDRLRSDVGIIYTRRGRIVIAVTTDDNPVVHYNWDGEAEELIWRISVLLQAGLNKN